MGLEARVRRLESARSARTAQAASGANPRLAKDYERLFELIEYARKVPQGSDAPVPEHLLANRDRGSERETIERLRSSGSGWEADPEAIEFLREWEADPGAQDREEHTGSLDHPRSASVPLDYVSANLRARCLTAKLHKSTFKD